jgi:hypothetical protein
MVFVDAFDYTLCERLVLYGRGRGGNSVVAILSCETRCRRWGGSGVIAILGRETKSRRRGIDGVIAILGRRG